VADYAERIILEQLLAQVHRKLYVGAEMARAQGLEGVHMDLEQINFEVARVAESLLDRRPKPITRPKGQLRIRSRMGGREWYISE